MAAARRAISSLLERHSDSIPEGSHFLLAVSGGADSTALAWAAEFVFPRHGCSCEAVIVDHGLQEGSAEIANTALDRLEAMGLRASILEVTVGEEGGIEHAARTARYAALTEAAAKAAGSCETGDAGSSLPLTGWVVLQWTLVMALARCVSLRQARALARV